jgi:hypothetical protein
MEHRGELATVDFRDDFGRSLARDDTELLRDEATDEATDERPELGDGRSPLRWTCLRLLSAPLRLLVLRPISVHIRYDIMSTLFQSLEETPGDAAWL